MQTFKTIVVVGTLLCVGIGAHKFMNKPIPNQALDIEDEAWEEFATTGIVQPPVDLDPKQTGQLSKNLPAFEPPGASSTPMTAPGTPVGPPAGAPPASPTPDLTSLPPLNPLPAPTSPTAVTPSVPGASPPAPTTPEQQTSLTTPVPSHPPQFEQTPVPPGTGPPAVATGPAVIPGPSETSPPAPQGFSSTWSNGFEEMWDSVQLKLQSSQYVDALLALSLFYNDQELTGEQRDRMVTLLDQLAGTVIYSSDYHMEPAYVTQPNDTLASVAAAYAVPESLLARINGISSGGVTTGTQLKVLRGPFRGELDVNGRQLTLFLGRYYAGRFSTGIGRDLPAQVGILEVVEKTGPRAFVDRRSGQQVDAGSPESPYGMYWIGLRDSQMADDTFLGIHSTGPAVDASDTRGCISVSEQDANDLQAILSSGSTITVLR